MPFLARHFYLEQQRKLAPCVLTSQRFAETIKIDKRGNAIFPHYDTKGLCGYEIKNQGFTGFAKGGQKGLWFSALNKQDTHLVIAESTIDAISYHILHPDKRTRYFSIGGSLNHQQPDLIRKAVARLAQPATLIIATDSDEAGCKLAGQIKNVIKSTGQNDLTIVRILPDKAKDWNDILRRQTNYKIMPVF